MTDFPLLVARASTLFDRLRGGFRPLSCDVSAARLAAWRTKAAKGDDGLFARRLGWLGTTPDDVLPLLGEGTWDGPLPSWTTILAEAMRRPTCVVEGERIAFGDLLRAFVPDVPARPELRDDLVATLSDIAGPTLYLEFAVARSSGMTYAQFVERGIAEIVEAYPVLARLLCQAVEMWLQSTRELEEALQSDRAELERTFNSGVPLGDAVSIVPSHSDRHDHGRSVAIVTFANRLRLVYKPRNIAVEVAWFDLLRELNDRGGELKLLRVLDCGGHGWVEFAKAEPCCNEDEVRRYYVRAGMLLAVLYALEASDCFYENIVAAGAWPLLIDMETLMHHVLRRSGDLAPAEEAADDIVFDSVMRAGLLPAWEAGANGVAVDISGLAAEPGQVTPYLRRRWVDVNRDSMQLEHVPIIVDSDVHLPHLGEQRVRAADHVDEVMDGFRTMYGILAAAHRDLEPSLATLGKCDIRVVFHATRIYGLLLKRLAAPQHFRSGVGRSIETDVISRFYAGVREKEDLWPILEAELQAVERLDIPRFEVRADSRTLRLETGRTIENVFAETGVDRVRHRLASLSEADLDRQCAFIRASLALSAISVRHDDRDAPAPVAETQRLVRGELIDAALQIAKLLEQRAIVSADGGATWIAAQLLPQTSRYQLRPLRMDLYNGLAGIAMFFAAMERVVPGSGARMARATLSPLRRYVSLADASRLAREGYTIGGATGSGSFVFALLRCAELLSDESLLADARTAAGAITNEWIAADTSLDAMSGSAGAALALLALHDATGDADALRRAIRCGEQLLAGTRARLTGFSHGAAGFAFALLRIAHASGDERFAKAAAEALDFETSVFDDAEGNWPDFRASERSFMNAWCHGAAGIGMARIAALPLLDTPQVRRDIAAAHAAVLHAGRGAKDGLCCGDLGRAELLVAAGDDRALDIASAVVAGARATGRYRMAGDFFDPSLFQGLAGIGYELLRIARPNAVRSAVIWQ